MVSNFILFKEYGLNDAYACLHKNEEMLLNDQIIPEVLGINFRKYLDSILQRELGKYSSFKPKGDLFSTIKSIDKNWPNCWVLSYLHDLRMEGNAAAHDANYTISKLRAIKMLKASHNILIWFFEDIIRKNVTFSSFNETFYTDNKDTEELIEKPFLKQNNNDTEFEYSQKIKTVLNLTQEKLANLFTGKHFVNAPPGTGKTELLTQRLGKALKIFKEDEIICLTFTSRAAFEMEERMKALIGEHDVSINNFHSWCWLNLNRNISKTNKKYRNLSLLDDEFREKFLYLELEKLQSETRILQNLQLNHCLGKIFNLIVPFSILECTDKELLRIAEHEWDKGVNSIIEISGKRNNGIRLNKNDLSVELKILLEAFKKIKEDIRAIDFDDIIAQNIIWLIDNPIKFKCIQIDEVQDLNVWQWIFINQISLEESNIFAVGDNDQSIYSFLGAEIKLLQKFTNSFKNHQLEENYRSNNSIIHLLNDYKKVNFNDTSIITTTKKNIENEPATLLLQTNNNRTEVDLISNAVKKVLTDPDRQVGILCQNNGQVDQFADALQRNDISSFRVSQFDFIHHPLMNDFTSFMKSFINRATLLDWYRLVFRIGKETGKYFKQTDAIKYVNSLKHFSVIPSDLIDSNHEGSQRVSYNYYLKDFINYYKNKSIIVFDTETTDLDVTNASVIQLSAVKVKNGQIVSEFDRYISLDNRTPETLNKLKETSEIHGITESILDEKGEEFSLVLNDFIEFIDDSYLVAHNLSYDVAVMERYISKYQNNNAISSDLFQKFIDTVQHRSMDTLKLSRQLYPLEKTYKLGDLLRSFSLEGVNSHNALDDVKATTNLLVKIISDMEPKLQALDDFISDNEQITQALQIELKNLNNLFFWQNINYDGIKSGQITLNGLIQIWISYVSDKDNWYESETIEKISKEIELKLRSWLANHTESKSNRYLLSVLNDELNKLAFLKEADLIVPGRDKVVISTIHRSKGLAFDTVIIPSVVDDSYPRFFSKTKSQIDEDKRLLYVAASRPKSKLIMIYYTEKMPWDSTNVFPTGLSRFIVPIQDSFDYSKVT